MDSFFKILKKGLIATVFVAFGLVATYIPQPYGSDNISKAEAQWAVFDAGTFGQSVLNLAQNTIAAVSSKAIWFKEYFLDGFAWILAKNIVSKMLTSMVDWINSGFKDRPMFVEDIQGFLLETADIAFGQYMEELEGPASFLCSPFKLDISLALRQQWNNSNMGQQPAPTCTLTGIIDNIEGFMTGNQGGFAQGGWNDWFDVTSQPSVYTPYGALLSAQAGAQVAMRNAQGEELNLLSFGNGFLSSKECSEATGPSGIKKQVCSVVTPGKTISEALSFNLDSGRQSLVQADEIDELIGALFGQLANQAIQGASGLLGLSRNGPSGIYTSRVNTEGESMVEASANSLAAERAAQAEQEAEQAREAREAEERAEQEDFGVIVTPPSGGGNSPDTPIQIVSRPMGTIDWTDLSEVPQGIDSKTFIGIALGGVSRDVYEFETSADTPRSGQIEIISSGGMSMSISNSERGFSLSTGRCSAQGQNFVINWEISSDSPASEGYCQLEENEVYYLRVQPYVCPGGTNVCDYYLNFN